MAPVTWAATRTVVLCGTGYISVSDDLGETWRTIHAKGFGYRRWWNCFTTSAGRHIVQSFGLQGPNDSVTDPDKHAALLVFDRDWQLLVRAKAGEAHWHGAASIGESGGTIMFADYHSNLERYSADFEQNKAEYLKTLRPNAIWRSTDGGINWHKVLELGPLEIRHFHTVIPDCFIPGTWWASRGDQTAESRVWGTDDNGDHWQEVTNTNPDIRLPAAFAPQKARCQRYTDVIVERDSLIWGADDCLGPMAETGEALPVSERTGSSIYASPKTSPLEPWEIGVVGHPVRKWVDVGLGWIILTKAKEAAIGLCPQVFLLLKEGLHLVKLLELENLSNKVTGFTYSRGSVTAYDGCFFTFRNTQDVFDGGVRCLKWQVEFE